MPSRPPLHANPGGQLSVDEIVGRSALARELLDTLELRSISLTGERRLGKTTLTTLLRALAPERGWQVVKLSLEGLETRDEFDAFVARELTQVGRSEAGKRAHTLKQSVDSASVAGLKFKPPSESLDEIVDAAMVRCEDRLLLVLDELPIFVRSADARSPGVGTNALQRLRRNREDRGLRMLMLGSIGFHHVVKDVTGVLNDVDKRVIGPLGEADAIELASRLLAGEHLAGHAADAVAAEIALRADCVPYYIHSIVEAAKHRPDRPTLSVRDIEEIVESHLVDPDWNMRHYRDRVPRYYGADAELATAALDAIAHDRRLDLDGVVARLDLDPGLAPVKRASVRDMLATLTDDHYLVSDPAGVRSFGFELVRRAWIATGL